MKKKNLLFLAILITCSVSAQKHVYVIEFKDVTDDDKTISQLENDKWIHSLAIPFHPLISLDKPDTPPTENEVEERIKDKYYISIHSMEDTIQVIKELLELEGDERLLCIPVRHGITSSVLFWGKQEWVSVQVYALYIIWGMFYNYEYTAAFATLRYGKSTDFEAVGGKVVKKAFTSYKKWFKESQGDLNYLRQNKPLKDTKIAWLL